MGRRTSAGQHPPPPAGTDHRAAFESLFAQTHLPLLAYAVRRVAQPTDAADVVADAFLVAWRRIEEAPTGAEARPWMFGIARGCLSNYYRGERRRSALADRLRESLGSTAAAQPTTADGLAVRDAIERLSESDRELVRLEAWEGLGRAEIAVALGCSQAAVRVRLHRARARLRQAMADVDAARPDASLASLPAGGPRRQPLPGVSPTRGDAPRTPTNTTRPQESPCVPS